MISKDIVECNTIKYDIISFTIHNSDKRNANSNNSSNNNDTKVVMK